MDTFLLAPPASLASPLTLHATAYIVQSADDAADPWLVGPDGGSLGFRVHRREWRLATDEGSLSVRHLTSDRSGYVYSGRSRVQVADCSDVFTRWTPQQRAAVERSAFRPAPADAPDGVGAGSTYRLVPYRSVAIDLAANAPVHLGQVLYIPKLRGAGVTLPDGRVITHDGYVMAVDTGGAIKGSHIDFFEGPRENDHVLSAPSGSFRAYVVTTPFAVAFMTAIHTRAGRAGAPRRGGQP